MNKTKIMNKIKGMNKVSEMKKIKAIFLIALVLLTTVKAQPAKEAVDGVVNCYDETVSIAHRTYDFAISALKALLRTVLSPRSLITEFFGFSITYAITKVVTVFIRDIFVIFGLFMKGFGAITGLCLSIPIGLLAAINFLCSNMIYLLSVFLVSVSSFIPEALSAYLHDFVFNFVEGCNDPWPTCMAIWPEIEYYMDILESLTSLSSSLGSAAQSLGTLGSLLTLPIDLVMNCAGGILNAMMYTKLGVCM
ncbi:MAG: hypothetical protein SVE93_04690 [Candidatus Thermoplasmatota archaeon]|nr:hypothetical protein [Candidatus Thermoplasmatota archaeon]